MVINAARARSPNDIVDLMRELWGRDSRVRSIIINIRVLLHCMQMPLCEKGALGPASRRTINNCAPGLRMSICSRLALNVVFHAIGEIKRDIVCFTTSINNIRLRKTTALHGVFEILTVFATAGLAEDFMRITWLCCLCVHLADLWDRNTKCGLNSMRKKAALRTCIPYECAISRWCARPAGRAGTANRFVWLRTAAAVWQCRGTCGDYDDPNWLLGESECVRLRGVVMVSCEIICERSCIGKWRTRCSGLWYR